MHPQIVHELARLKIADELAYAERERRARLAAAASGRRGSIDFTALLRGARVRILGQGGSLRGRPADSGA